MNEDLVISGGHTTGIRRPGNDRPVAYGCHRIVTKEIFLRMGCHMYVVGERGISDYNVAHEALQNAEIVFCLGLSTAGICQSLFQFGDNQTVHLSNKGDDIHKIAACKGSANFQSLGTDVNRLESKCFPNKFKSIAFESLL